MSNKLAFELLWLSIDELPREELVAALGLKGSQVGRLKAEAEEYVTMKARARLAEEERV